MSMENIETNRLLLRKFNANDVEECFINFGQNKEIGRYLPMYPVDDKVEMKNMIDGIFDRLAEMGVSDPLVTAYWQEWSEP